MNKSEERLEKIDKLVQKANNNDIVGFLDGLSDYLRWDGAYSNFRVAICKVVKEAANQLKEK